MKTLIFSLLMVLNWLPLAFGVEASSEGPEQTCDGLVEGPDTEELEEINFRFHGKYEGVDKEVIQRLVERSQGAFESGAFDLAAISFALENKLFVVSRIQPDEGKAFFSISAKDLSQTPLNEKQIRLSAHATSGGTQRQHYFSEKSLKEQLARYPTYSTGKHYGAYLTTDSGQVWFAIYIDQEDQKKKQRVREIKEIYYPRSYRISQRTKERIQAVSNITLDVLDSAFSEWDGSAYDETDIHRLKRMELNNKVGRYHWFLVPFEDGKTMKVVTYSNETTSVPVVVTARFLGPVALEEHLEKARQMTLKVIFPAKEN